MNFESLKYLDLFKFFMDAAFGGLLMLWFISERLYLENIKYPYVAVSGCILFFIFSVILNIYKDDIYKKYLVERKE